MTTIPENLLENTRHRDLHQAAQDHVDGAGSFDGSHDSLTGVTSDQHHDEVHDVDGADHNFPGGAGTTYLDDTGAFTTPAGGSAITIKEVDGSPSGTPSTLEFPNGTLTDHGSGVYEYVPAASGGSSTNYYFRAYRNAAYTPGASGSQTVPFDTVDSDPNSNFTTGSSAHYTAPVTGLYAFYARLSVATGPGRYFLQLLVNGSEVRRGTDITDATNILGSILAVQVHLTAGDTVSVACYMGTARAIEAGGGTAFFEGRQVGVSGAASGDHFVVGQGGENDTDLTNKIVIPGLSASPDIRVAGANDWEFDSSTTTGWSSFAGGGSIAAWDFNTTFKSMLYVKGNTNGSFDKFGGVIHAAPSVPYTVTAKCAARQAGQGWPVLFVSDSSTGAGNGVFVGAWDGNGTTPANFRGGTCTNMAAFSSFTDSGKSVGVGSPFYVRIVVHAANNVDILTSYDGLIWFTLHAGYSLLSTAAYFGVANDCYNFTGEMAWDWIRFS